MFDELKILITGDTSGIANAVKKSVNIVQGGVKQMNSQEVDWTGIFSRSVSPAIISGIASLFAFAISQSMQFQDAMNQTGTAAGFSSDQIKATSAAALTLSTTLPSSAEDLGAAMAHVGALFKTTSEQQAVVAAMAQLSASGFGDLNDIVSSSIDLFRKWGVSTSTEAVAVLTALMHGAEAAKESIPELAKQFASFDPNLAGASLSDFNGILSAFASEVQTIGGQGAQQIFSELAQGASDASAPMALLGGGVEAVRKSLKDNGGLDVIQKVAGVLSSQFGNNVGLIAKNFGLAADNVDALINSGKQFSTIADNADKIKNNSQDIAGAFQQSDSFLRDLLLDWNKLKESFLQSSFWNSLSKGVAGFAGVFTDAIVNANKGLDDLSKMTEKVFSPDFGHKVLLNKALQGTGVGFSNDMLSRIDESSGSSAMMDSLVNALSTGIKSGQYTSLVNTFHLTVPQGSQGLTAKMIAQQLYNQFQGTQ